MKRDLFAQSAPKIGALRRRQGTADIAIAGKAYVGVTGNYAMRNGQTMPTDRFLKSIKYEFHGPEGSGDLQAITEVLWRRGFRTIDLFAGIGGIRLGFESVGGHCVFSSEWDREAQDTYEANFGDRPFGDITKIQPEDIPDHDVLLAGFPCQPFSIIGNGKGFSDTRGLLTTIVPSCGNSVSSFLTGQQTPDSFLGRILHFRMSASIQTISRPRQSPRS